MICGTGWGKSITEHGPRKLCKNLLFRSVPHQSRVVRLSLNLPCAITLLGSKIVIVYGRGLKPKVCSPHEYTQRKLLA